MGLLVHRAILLAFFVHSLGIFCCRADEIRLPAPGVMVHLSPEYNPPVLKGVTVDPKNPFRFDFILDRGDTEIQNDPEQVEGLPLDKGDEQTKDHRLKTTELKEEANRLIKYFLASITTPEKDLWVNLSPYEKEKIIPESFGQTDMGKDLLAQDYMLKQITSSLIYPEDEFGKKFWKRVYEEAAKRYGTTNIPVNTFNKVWIVPDHAKVYEHGNTAFVLKAHLKVMLEEDYKALSHQRDRVESRGQDPDIKQVSTADPPKADQGVGVNPRTQEKTNTLGSQIIREIILPALEKEVNEGKNFIRLRQIYHSLILAVWFKKQMSAKGGSASGGKDHLLARKYMDQNKIKGIDINDKDSKQKIYERYLMAFKKGVYNYIKEETDPVSGESIPRKYFSGGFSMPKDFSMHSVDYTQRMNLDEASLSGAFQVRVGLDRALASDSVLVGNKTRAQDISQTRAIQTLKEFELRRLITPKALQAIEKLLSVLSIDDLNQIEFKIANYFQHYMVSFFGLRTYVAYAQRKDLFNRSYKVVSSRKTKLMTIEEVFHELGHIMDFKTKAQDGWFKQYALQYQQVITTYFKENYFMNREDHFLSNPLEMFAQLFSDYVMAYRLTSQEIHKISIEEDPTVDFPELMGDIERRNSEIRASFEGPLAGLRAKFEKILPLSNMEGEGNSIQATTSKLIQEDHQMQASSSRQSAKINYDNLSPEEFTRVIKEYSAEKDVTAFITNRFPGWNVTELLKRYNAIEKLFVIEDSMMDDFMRKSKRVRVKAFSVCGFIFLRESEFKKYLEGDNLVRWVILHERRHIEYPDWGPYTTESHIRSELYALMAGTFDLAKTEVFRAGKEFQYEGKRFDSFRSFVIHELRTHTFPMMPLDDLSLKFFDKYLNEIVDIYIRFMSMDERTAAMFLDFLKDIPFKDFGNEWPPIYYIMGAGNTYFDNSNNSPEIAKENNQIKIFHQVFISYRQLWEEANPVNFTEGKSVQTLEHGIIKSENFKASSSAQERDQQMQASPSNPMVGDEAMDAMKAPGRIDPTAKQMDLEVKQGKTHPISFKTAYGSNYQIIRSEIGHDRGWISTQRDKTPHPGHPERDVGIQETSRITFFVSSPEEALRIGNHATLQVGKKMVMVDSSGANLVLRLVTAPDKPDFKWNQFGDPIIISPVPLINSSPVEFFGVLSISPNKEAIACSKWHVGNEITSIEEGALTSNADTIKPNGPGGIDLTANRMKLDVEKDKAQIRQPMDLKSLENIEINGLYIKDIEIKPLENLPELLGLSPN